MLQKIGFANVMHEMKCIQNICQSLRIHTMRLSAATLNVNITFVYKKTPQGAFNSIIRVIFKSES